MYIVNLSILPCHCLGVWRTCALQSAGCERMVVMSPFAAQWPRMLSVVSLQSQRRLQQLLSLSCHSSSSVVYCPHWPCSRSHPTSTDHQPVTSEVQGLQSVCLTVQTSWDRHHADIMRQCRGCNLSVWQCRHHETDIMLTSWDSAGAAICLSDSADIMRQTSCWHHETVQGLQSVCLTVQTSWDRHHADIMRQCRGCNLSEYCQLSDAIWCKISVVEAIDRLAQWSPISQWLSVWCPVTHRIYKLGRDNACLTIHWTANPVVIRHLPCCDACSLSAHNGDLYGTFFLEYFITKILYPKDELSTMWHEWEGYIASWFQKCQVLEARDVSVPMLLCSVIRFENLDILSELVTYLYITFCSHFSQPFYAMIYLSDGIFFVVFCYVFRALIFAICNFSAFQHYLFLTILSMRRFWFFFDDNWIRLIHVFSWWCVACFHLPSLCLPMSLSVECFPLHFSMMIFWFLPLSLMAFQQHLLTFTRSCDIIRKHVFSNSYTVLLQVKYILLFYILPDNEFRITHCYHQNSVHLISSLS